MEETRDHQDSLHVLTGLICLDENLIALCEEAIEYLTPNDPQLIRVSARDLKRLERMVVHCYENTCSVQVMIDVTHSLHSHTVTWQKVATTIINYHWMTLNSPAWKLRASHIQENGDRLWRLSVPDLEFAESKDQDMIIEAIAEKLTVVDSILDSLYERIPSLGTRQSLSMEWRDTALAFKNIRKRSSSVELTPELVEKYKAELRQRRKAPLLNIIDEAAASAGAPSDGGNPPQVQALPGTNTTATVEDKFKPLSRTVALLFTATSIFLMTKVWSLSDKARPGTLADPEFWALLSSCIMQAAALWPVSLRLWALSTAPTQSRVLMWLFAGVSLAATCLAPVLYLFVLPKAWGGLVAFIGAVLQVFILVESLSMVVTTAAPSKAHVS